MAFPSFKYTLTVSFQANALGDSVANLPSTQTKTIVGRAYVPTTIYINIPSNIPKRTGYNFLGYARDSNGEVFKQPGDQYAETFSGASDQSIHRSIYCVWEIQEYTISYNANGGSNAPAQQTKTYGTPINLSNAIPQRYGYIFTGWNTAPNGTGASYQSGATYSANESVTLYAQWISSAVTLTITKQPVGATYGVGDTPQKISVSATSNAPITYQWQKSADGATWTNVTGQTSSSLLPTTSAAGQTYYRCVATASGVSEIVAKTSNSARIVVAAASAPTFYYNLALVDATYNVGDIPAALNGTAKVTSGTIAYQWQKSTDNKATWFSIIGANSPTYAPPTNIGGVAYYRVIATNKVGSSTASSYSGEAKITVISTILSFDKAWAQYLNAARKPFIKLARLDFLNPNGSVLFSLDNNTNNPKSKAFIQDGELSVNLQNGQRRTATITLSNLDGEYDYNVNKLWFGQQVRLWEGMVLPNGQEFYISQGVFYVKDPDEVVDPGLRQTTLHLVDKWAYLDGTLFGNLDGTYEVPLNSNIFNAIQSVLNLDRGNGQKIDSAIPVFTNYSNGKTTTLPDGSTVPITNTPYTYRCDSEDGTYADIVLELNTMLAGWIGYDANGQLRLDPSQDDILDTTKPVLWNFSTENSTLLGATYSVKNSEVYNDIIIIGESLSDYGQTTGRATNYDPQSDTNANIIGLKTKRYQQSGYYTQDICESLAVFRLKRESILKKSVSIKCSQLFHLQENNLVTIERTDKVGNPIERHLITGYTRPIAQTGDMVVNAVSCLDFPVATVTYAP